MSAGAWDAAVIGGGPAGCSTAISLAQRGFRVILFEAKTYPHNKMCGEFLSPECSGFLDSLQVLTDVESLNPVKINSVRVTAPDGSSWESSLPGSALGLSRESLDAALADRARRAGVVLHEATAITSVEGRLGDQFRLEGVCRGRHEGYSSRVVIAAHGKRASLDRVLDRSFLRQQHPFIALKAHFQGPPISERVDLFTFPGGYCGMSEIENDSRVVCLLVHQHAFLKHRGSGAGSLEKFIDWMKEENPSIGSWMRFAGKTTRGWVSIAQIPFGMKPVVESEILMAGDAAGSIAPFAGNGIAMALGSGILAADYVAYYLSGEIRVEELRVAYARAWRGRYSRRIRLGQIVQPLMLFPPAVTPVLRLLNWFPGAGHYLIDGTRDSPGSIRFDRRKTII